MIDNCINRPLITAEVVGMALTRRINELIDASVRWISMHDDNRMEQAEELGNSAFWVVINELTQWRDIIDRDINAMLDEQAKAFQDE